MPIASGTISGCFNMEKHLLSKFSKKPTWQTSAAYIAKIALLTALAFILYAFCKFPLPFAFPSFLDIQISELPALLAGFSMGPISGAVVVILKCLFKLPMSGTMYVGELTDIIIGLCFVVPSSVIYRRHKDKKHALTGLAVSSVLVVAASLLINRFISIPFYVEVMFKGNFNILLDMVRPLYPAVTQGTFYAYYLGVAVLPFNVLRTLIVAVLTFILYKRLSGILHWNGTSKKKKDISGEYVSESEEDTRAVAAKIADSLTGGEIILLDGDLGAGKTAFTKGLAEALGIEDAVTSPTFTIMNVYEGGRLKLNHLDMYRTEDADEIAELGVEEEFDENSVTVIEWNKLQDLTGRIINVKITVTGDNDRVIEVEDGRETQSEKSKGKTTLKKSKKTEESNEISCN